MTNDKNFSNEPLHRFLEGLAFGEARRLNDLTLVPVLSGTAHSPVYLDLEGALRAGLASVTEISTSGSVPELSVNNSGQTDLLILDGEELIGAKQNRTVNVTIIIAAGMKTTIPVTCVERGRWHYQTQEFSSGDAHLYPSLRSERAADVAANLRVSQSRAADQGAVWDNIADKSLRMGVNSQTDAMQDIYSQKLKDLDRLNEVFAWQETQCGFAAFIRGGFAGADIFGTPQFCSVKLSKLVRGFYLDSLDPAVAFPEISVPQIIRDIQTARHEPFESPGKGVEVRFENNQLHGAWTADGAAIPHLAIFPRLRRPSRRGWLGLVY